MEKQNCPLYLNHREKGFTFTRLDGSMSSNARTAALREFSSPAPDSPQIFLLSLKAGGVGLNLTAASRLYLLDPVSFHFVLPFSF